MSRNGGRKTRKDLSVAIGVSLIALLVASVSLIAIMDARSGLISDIRKLASGSKELEELNRKIEFEAVNFPSSTVVIAVVGDCSGYNIVEYRGKSLDPLGSARCLIEQSDIFLFNMEGVILPAEYLGFSTIYPDQSCFVSPPSFASYMKAGTLTVASLANNHILDGGETGVERTRSALAENGIDCVGAGGNAAEACQPLLLAVKGVKIGFLAYNLVNELVFSAKGDRAGAASFTACNVADCVRLLKMKADVVVVALHWGTSWTQEVKASQIVAADQIHQAGADIVIGHHPHMLQAFKAYEKGLTIFSLGNFVLRPDYPMPAEAHNSVVALIEIAERKVRRCYLYPVRLDDYGVPRLPTRLEARIILSNLADLSEAFNTQIEVEKWIGKIRIRDVDSIVDGHFTLALAHSGYNRMAVLSVYQQRSRNAPRGAS